MKDNKIPSPLVSFTRIRTYLLLFVTIRTFGKRCLVRWQSSLSVSGYSSLCADRYGGIPSSMEGLRTGYHQ